MAEFTANTVQTVNSNSNVLFTDTVIYGSNSILHRDGSGLVTLRGLTCQPRARFRIFFGGNIAIPVGGAPGPISLAIAVDGEPVQTTTMTVTPTVADAFFNVAGSIYLHVPAGCCSHISVQNVTAGTAVQVKNANLIVERVA